MKKCLICKKKITGKYIQQKKCCSKKCSHEKDKFRWIKRKKEKNYTESQQPTQKKYFKKNKKSFKKYIGKVVCGRCNNIGYMDERWQYNYKTSVESTHWYCIQHYEGKGKERKYKSSCWIKNERLF